MTGSLLNHMHFLAVSEFNQHANKNETHEYARAFWNGYGVAAGLIRDNVRHFPADSGPIEPKVQ